MSRLRIAVATARLTSNLREVPKLAAESGASGVQFDARHQLRPTDLSETGRRQLLHSLSERDLTVASLSFSLRRNLHDQEYLDERIAALQQALQFAWNMKARVVTCRVGRVPDPADAAEYARLREILADLAKFGNRVGTTLAITPAGDQASALLALIESIDEGPLGINFDAAERVMARMNAASSLSDWHSVVSHVTVRDALRDADGGGREVPLGRGECDWPELLSILDEMKYPGWLTVDRTAGDDPLGDTTRAVKFLRNVAGG